MRKGVWWVLALVVMVGVVLCCPAASVQAQEKVIRLKYACFFPAAHKGNILTEQWCREVERRTKNRVKITFLGGATLVPGPQGYEAAVRGIADISNGAPSWTAGRFPLSEVLELPLGYKDAAQASRLANAFFKKFKPKEYDDTRILYMHAHGPGYFHTKKIIASLDEVKGLRIKSSGLSAKIVSAMGGAPVTIPIPETYDALQRGLCDGVLLNNDVLKSLRYGDFCKCTVLNSGVGYTVSFFVTMNKEKWNSLPPDIQKIFEQVSEEYAQKMGKAWDDADREAEDFVRQKGEHKFVQASKEDVAKAREKMKPLLNEYVQNMKAKNLPGEEALKFCQDWLRTHP